MKTDAIYNHELPSFSTALGILSSRAKELQDDFHRIIRSHSTVSPILGEIVHIAETPEEVAMLSMWFGGWRERINKRMIHPLEMLKEMIEGGDDA